MSKIELEAQIKILLELQYTTAYTGSLQDLKPKSYVLYSDITKLLNQKRLELLKLK